MDEQLFIQAMTPMQPTLFKGSNGVELRRKMLEMPEIAKGLDVTEKYIFVASTKKTIADTPESELIKNVGELVKYIGRDAGIKRIEQYEVTRIYDILRKHYFKLSLYEIKLAFEYAWVGKLDDYLPKDREGNPDRNHYQQFSIEYLSKIVNAYMKFRAKTIHKAVNLLPEKKTEITEEERIRNRKLVRLDMYRCFLRYKHSGIFEIRGIIIIEHLLYELLERNDFIGQIEINNNDKWDAFEIVMKRISNQLMKESVNRMKIDHPEVVDSAYFIARRRVIRESFDRMIKDGIDFKNILRK